MIGDQASTAFPAALPRPDAANVGAGVLGFIGLTGLAVVLTLVATGDPITAAMPVVAILAIWLFVSVPIRATLFLYWFLLVLSEADRVALPTGGTYTPPLRTLSVMLSDNMNNWLPVQALRFSLADLLFVLLLGLAGLRTFMRLRVDSAGRGKSSNILMALLVVSFVCSIAFEFWGVVVNHGDFRQSLWQGRQVTLMPMVAFLFSLALRHDRDFQRMLTLLVAAACLKIVLIVHFWFTVAVPLGFEPPAITSHADSVLFAVAFMTLFVRFLHAATFKNLAYLALWGSWILYGIVLNNRRLAFVNIGICVIVAFIVLRGPVKKAILKIITYSLPIIALYFIVGQRSNAKIFKPAKLIGSVTSQSDASSKTRDIENYNLIQTLKANKVIGPGWGHEYKELVKAYDIASVFAQYKFIAHNNILWLWSVFGLVGFTIIWMPVAVGVFFARRAYYFAATTSERVSAAMCLCMFCVFVSQAWGDFGTQGLTSSISVACAIAMATKLAVSTGAFPAKLTLARFQRAVPHVQTTVARSSVSL